jgi:hypothetical protein
MYACFKPIPKDIRQQAFEIIVQSGYFASCYGYPYQSCIGKIGNRHVCPLGAVNYLFRDKLPQKLKFSIGDSPEGQYNYTMAVNIFMPGYGKIEQELLAKVGIIVSKKDADNFMIANDRHRFDTPEKLATAMGAVYQSGE